MGKPTKLKQAFSPPRKRHPKVKCHFCEGIGRPNHPIDGCGRTRRKDLSGVVVPVG